MLRRPRRNAKRRDKHEGAVAISVWVADGITIATTTAIGDATAMPKGLQWLEW